MPRSRNIKPSFFTNDELAEIDPIGRLLFIGLWTLADYKGELEYREKKIKAQLLPYDDCDIKKIAINLDKSGFIRFYSDGDKVYINIVNFNKHQNPHKNEREKGSDIPSYSENMRQLIDLKGLTINRDKSRSNHDENETNPADSCFLIPDSCSLIPESKSKAKRFAPPSIEEVRDYCHERSNSVDPQRFIDFYQSKGWLVGKAKMKDWKAAVRGWEKRESKERPQINSNSTEWANDMSEVF